MHTEQAITKHRIITLLNRQEIEFLDKLGKDALFSTGHKLSYNEILKGLVEFLMEIGLSGEKVDSFSALKEKIAQKMALRIKANEETQKPTGGLR